MAIRDRRLKFKSLVRRNAYEVNLQRAEYNPRTRPHYLLFFVTDKKIC